MIPLLLLTMNGLSAGPTVDTWPAFRGDGTSRTTANVPVTWSPKEAVAWKVPTAGYGQSSPVVWKGTVFLTSVEGNEKETLIVSSFDGYGGKQRWSKTFPASQKGKNNPMMSRAAGTPVVDAEGVYAFFESGDVLALGHNGDLRWQRSLVKEYGEIKNNHGAGSSLIQTADAVIALVDNQASSYLIAVRKADGTNLWKADRPSRNSWTSPVLNTGSGRPVVVVSSGGAVTSYDATDGKKLWEFDGLKGNTIASPTTANDLVVMAAGDDRMKPDQAVSSASNCCVRLTTKDGQPGYEMVWKAKKVLGATASPVVVDDFAYYVDKAGLLHCVDMKTGDIKYSERLENQVWATPIATGSLLYCFGKDGVTTVVKTGPTFEKVSSNRLWSAEDFEARKAEAKKKSPAPMGGPPGGTRPSGGPPGVPPAEAESMRYSAVGDVVYGVAAVDGAFYVRTGTELFCIRK
jgi:outer membrane protein assembly factor BamB